MLDKYHLGKANQVTDVLSRKSHSMDMVESSGVDSLLFKMRRLLVGSAQQEEILASMHKFRVMNFEELKVLQSGTRSC